MEIIKPINRDDWGDADPVNNIPGAIPPAKAFSQTMEEMVNVILASGQEPSGEDLHQFEKGIKQLVQLKVDEANLLAVSNTIYQRNVGDFFYTNNKMRGTKATGSLNGGYECNGDEFAEADFTGDANPYTLLVNNQLPWVSYDNYAQILARFGNCGYFGLDKTNKKFKVPTITTAFLQSGTPGTFKEAGLPNITGEFASGANVSWADTRTEWKGAFRLGNARGGTGERRGMVQYFGKFDASWSNSIYGKSSTVQPPAIGTRIMVQLANEIDNATSVEKYLAQIKDAQKAALAAIQTSISNLSATAEKALADIATDKTGALTAIDTAKTNALEALQKLYDESIADIQVEIEDLKKYVDETVEPLYEAFDDALEKSDTNIATLTTQNNKAEQNITTLTPLNEGATELAYAVQLNATAAENAATAATNAQTAVETAVNGFPLTVAAYTQEAQNAITTARNNAVTAIENTVSEVETSVNQAAATAETAKNTANSVVTQLEGFTDSVNTAKTEITTLATTEKTGISTAATNAQTAATTAIDNAKTNAVEAVEAAAAELTAHSANKDNPHEVTKDQVGLGNVDNTSDANKPISTAVQEALAEKAPLASPSFSGVPTVPTQAVGNNSTAAASTGYVNNFQPAITTLSQTSGTVALAVNKIYSMTISGATTFTLPTPSNTNVFNQIKVILKVTGTPTINWGTTNFFNKATPEIAAGSYDVYFDYDKLMNAWVAGAMPKGAA